MMKLTGPQAFGGVVFLLMFLTGYNPLLDAALSGLIWWGIAALAVRIFQKITGRDGDKANTTDVR